MIEEGFNYLDSTVKEMTDFIKTRVDNQGRQEEKKKSSMDLKKKNYEKSTKKRKRADSDSSVVESSEVSIFC